MRLSLGEAFRKGEKKKKRKPSFRWLQICLAGGSRDLILPVHTEEGLISQGRCGDFGKVPLAAAGGLVPRPGHRHGDIMGRCSHRHCFPAWDPVCPAPKGSQGSKSSQKLQDGSRGCPLKDKRGVRAGLGAPAPCSLLARS